MYTITHGVFNMTNNEINFEAKSIDRFSENLKILLENANYNQKNFSEITQISESTLSGYLRGKKQPSISFLIKIKELFPDITIDQILFESLKDTINDELAENTSSPVLDINKYYGAYYLYYIDTSKKNLTRQPESPGYLSVDLRFGILYVCKDNTDKTSTKTKCLAVFGIKKRNEAKEIKQHVEALNKYDTIRHYFKENFPHGLYFGEINISQQHLFITLIKSQDTKDSALVVLHHTEINKEVYSGGLGTINSASTGRSSDPIVQLIALSRDSAYLSDEQIKSRLRFAPPNVSVKSAMESSEILRLAESIYKKDSSSQEQSAYSLFSTQNIKVLVNSYLESLIVNHLENNQLWFGRVSNNDDDDWYHMLKDSEAIHIQQEAGEDSEPSNKSTKDY